MTPPDPIRIELVALAKAGINISGEHPANASEPWCSATQKRFKFMESQNLANSKVSLRARFAFVFVNMGD